MINFIAVAIGLYTAFVGGLYLVQRELIYLPSGPMSTPAESGVPEMRPIRLTTADGLTLTSWYRPAETGQPTMVYFQGNGGNMAGRAFKVRPYLDAGFGMLLVGYRGYGENPGKPSEQGLYADGRAQFKFLEGQGVRPQSWVAYGESLGAGVAVQLAMEQARSFPIGAIILEAPFASLGDVAAVHYPFVPARFLIKDRFESIAKIAMVKAPVFIVNGVNDGVIPSGQGQQLFEAALEPKEGHWISGAGHNDLYDYGVAGMVIEFIRRKAVAGKKEKS